MKDTLLNKHGRATYKMAWVVEIGLLVLAIGVAVFNIKSVIETGGTIFNAILLGVGWLIIGVIELATIPLAGSLRIARWKDKWLAIIGVIGMTCLSAWTVYEFNEFASYSMTMPARKGLITVENKENEINDLKNQNSKMVESNKSADQKLKSFSAKKGNLIEENRNNREVKLGQIFSEKKRELNELDSQIQELQNQGPLSATQNAKIGDNENEIERLSQEMDSKVAEVNKRSVDAKSDRSASADSSKETLNEQISQINQKISQLNEQKLDEVNNIKKGAFLKSKEALKNQIRTDYDKQIREQESQLALVRKELSGTNIAFDSTEFDQEIASIKSEYQSKMDSLRDKNKEIREEAHQQSAALIKKLNDEADELNKDKKDVIAKYALLLQAAKGEFEKKRNEINKSYDKKTSEYADAVKTDAEVQNLQTENEAKIIAAQNQITGLIKDVELQMEPILYYRMAKWFHPGEGLPDKEAYVKAQAYIFAPMGLFFGLVSIALAYIGTGLKSDAESPDELEKTHRDQTKQIKLMDKKVSKLSSDLEKERLSKAEWKLAQLNKIENAFENKQEQITNNKDQVISKLHLALDKSIEDVVNMKKQLSNTVSSIPQKIVMKDELKDLVSYQRFSNVDFSSDEIAQFGNFQVVNA